MFAVTWALLGLSLVCAAPVIFMRITDTVTLEQDLQISDQTVQDVVVGAADPTDKRADA